MQPFSCDDTHIRRLVFRIHLPTRPRIAWTQVTARIVLRQDRHDGLVGLALGVSAGSRDRIVMGACSICGALLDLRMSRCEGFREVRGDQPSSVVLEVF